LMSLQRHFLRKMRGKLKWKKLKSMYC
jgi:hypothetical protein